MSETTHETTSEKAPRKRTPAMAAASMLVSATRKVADIKASITGLEGRLAAKRDSLKEAEQRLREAKELLSGELDGE